MRERLKQIGRLALCTWAGASAWAGATVPVQIIPAQASPGERVVVQISAENPARECGTRVAVAIGSVRVERYDCSPGGTEGGVWYGFRVPAGEGAPMPGPQRLEVVRPGEVLNVEQVQKEPNFEVLPAGGGVVVAASAQAFRDLNRNNELDLRLLARQSNLVRLRDPLPAIPTPLFERYVAPELGALQRIQVPLPVLQPRLPGVSPGRTLPLPSLPYPYPLNRVIPRELPRAPLITLPSTSIQGRLGYGLEFPVRGTSVLGGQLLAPGAVERQRPIPVLPAPGSPLQICGSSRFGRDDFGGPLGLTIELARRTYGETGGLLIAPDTSLHPPHTTQNGSGPYANLDQRKAAWGTAMRSIGTMTDASGQMERAPNLGTGKGVHVFLIDTLAALSPAAETQAGLDAYPTHLETLWGETYLSQGHGIAAWTLLSDSRFGVAPGVTIHPVPACGPDGRCQMEAVLRGLCAAADHHRATGRPVVVNLSLATPYNHPLLRQALSEVTGAGVAVVVAYGNDDRCRAPGRGDQDRCNAFPADWTGDMSARPPLKALYSVGAKENDWRAVQSFQRGISSGLTVSTQPSVYAPAFFWLGVGNLAPWSASAPGRRAEWNAALARSDLRPYKGTSFAAPLVTGALALWKEAHPSDPNWPTLNGNLCVLGPADPAACPTPLLP